MGKTQMRSNAETTFAYEYDATTNDSTISEKVGDLADWCQHVGIDIKTERKGRLLVMDFNSRADMLTVRACKFRGTGTSTHTETFDTQSPDYQAGWVRVVDSFLKQAGIEHGISQAGNTVTIAFETMQAAMLFGEMQRTGFFDRMAKPVPEGGPYPI